MVVILLFSGFFIIISTLDGISPVNTHIVFMPKCRRQIVYGVVDDDDDDAE